MNLSPMYLFISQVRDIIACSGIYELKLITNISRPPTMTKVKKYKYYLSDKSLQSLLLYIFINLKFLLLVFLLCTNEYENLRQLLNFIPGQNSYPLLTCH